MRYLGVHFVKSRSLKCSLDKAKRGFFRATNAVFGKIGSVASEEVVIELVMNKRDGYRQQNVRQRQKLISIIDYDVCIWRICSHFGDIQR